MEQALHPLGRALEVDAVAVGLALEADELVAADRALGRERPRDGAGWRSDSHRGHDLGDDVAGLADDDGVALPHVLAGHLVLVVEGGPGHGRAADEDRVSAANGVARPVRPMLTEDPLAGPSSSPRAGT